MGGRESRQERRVFLHAAARAAGLVAATFFIPGIVFASGPVIVRGVRVGGGGGKTRIVLDLSGRTDHSIITLGDPDRIVVDLDTARLAGGALPPAIPRGSILTGVRHGVRNGSDLRVVLDLATQARPNSFLLAPGNGAGHRLVVDLEHGAVPVAVSRQAAASSRTPAAAPLREVVIAIDAGHGGRDPGAVGPGGTYEKDIVLAIARRLETQVRREPGMRPVMIRTGDHFITLRDRINRARAAKADVFISIHADAAPNRQAAGSSVYVLSQHGATSERARWLAERENAADLVGGVQLGNRDEMLASVLLDLSQAAAVEASMTLAESLIGELHRVGKVRSRRIEQAGFVVLKSPDVPSVLVETAFISNPEEERKLRTPAFQQSMAEALMGGLRYHFDRHAPPGTVLAEQRRNRHVIRPGDTLSAIAGRYRVGVDDLRRQNNLRSDNIHAGQVLVIPTRQDG